MQGTVLSWNNFCYQASMISCPLILSAIYMKNHDAIYYFSSGFAFVGLIVMIILACRKDCKTLGKVPMYSEESSEEKKPVEMEEKKPEVKDNESSGNVEVPMQAKPVADALRVCWRMVWRSWLTWGCFSLHCIFWIAIH